MQIIEKLKSKLTHHEKPHASTEKPADDDSSSSSSDDDSGLLGKKGDKGDKIHSWKAGKTYGVGDVVKYRGKQYKCTLGHVSSKTSTPLTSTTWSSVDAVTPTPVTPTPVTPTPVTDATTL